MIEKIALLDFILFFLNFIFACVYFIVLLVRVRVCALAMKYALKMRM